MLLIQKLMTPAITIILLQAKKTQTTGRHLNKQNWSSICNFLSGAKTTKLTRLILYGPVPCGNSPTKQQYKSNDCFSW